MAAHNKLIIPKKINVGFQKRAGTYTGKLAFVVYTDDKGVLKKEKSWNDWRDHKIDPVEFDNVPTSGFVLNKKVGDHRGGWNGRLAWVRVWDPRNFEFEIAVDNLLFILEECSAIKGKGLEGEFVYSWDGTSLVLLPVDSQDYKNSVIHTERQGKKVKAKEVKPGYLYMTKDGEEVMYLGKHEYYTLQSEYVYGGNANRKHLSATTLHVFVSVDGKSTYWTQTGFTKLAHQIGETPSPLYADEFEKFKNSIYGSPPAAANELLVAKPTNLDLAELEKWYWRTKYYKKRKDGYVSTEIRKEYGNKVYRVMESRTPVQVNTDGSVLVAGPHGNDYKILTEEELLALPMVELHLKTQSGALVAI